MFFKLHRTHKEESLHYQIENYNLLEKYVNKLIDDFVKEKGYRPNLIYLTGNQYKTVDFVIHLLSVSNRLKEPNMNYFCGLQIKFGNNLIVKYENEPLIFKMEI